MIPFVTKYSRPCKFSNAHHHFPQKTLDKILKTPDEQLGWWEFGIIFHFGTPAGRYEEIVYFLPFACHYIQYHPSESLDCLSNVLCFLSHEYTRLNEDGLIEFCRKAIRSWFTTWTQTFTVIHYDKETCQQKQWIIEYDDIVENSQVVCELIDLLCRYKTYTDVAESLIATLADINNSPESSAWFLEYVYQCRKAYEYYSKSNVQQRKENYKAIQETIQGELQEISEGGDVDNNIYELDVPLLSRLDMTPTKSVPSIVKVIMDNELVRSHYVKIKDSIVTQESSPTYWRDVISFLGI